MKALFASLVGVVAILSFVPMAAANPADPDTSFATGGTFTGEDSNCAEFRMLLIVSGGRILAGANAADPPPNEGSIHRFLPDGSRDTSFGGGDGVVWLLDLVGVTHPQVRALTEFPSGAIAAAVTDGSGKWVVRLDTSGSPDPGFDGDGILSGPWTALARIGLDDLLVAGMDGGGHLVLGRLDATGALVPSFGSGGTVTSLLIDGEGTSEVLIQPDGKILVDGDKAGGFFVARFLADGSPDSSFGTSGVFEHVGALETVRDMSLAPDGEVLITGCEAGGGVCNSNDSPTAVRLTGSGAIDTTFDGDGIASPTGSGGESQGIAVQQNGKIFLSGHGQPVERLLVNGSLDPSFGSGGIGSKVGFKVAVQRNGKILVAGSDNNGSDYRCQLHRLLGDPIDVPAVSGWGMILMSLMMMSGGVLFSWRVRKVQHARDLSSGLPVGTGLGS